MDERGFANLPFAGLDAIGSGTLAVVGCPFGADGTEDGAGALRMASRERIAPYLASPSRTVIDIETGHSSRLLAKPNGVDLGDLATPVAAERVVRHIHGAGGIPVLLGGGATVGEALVESIPGRPGLLAIVHDLAIAGPHAAADRAALCLGVNGLQGAASWDAVRAAGAEVISADDVHDDEPVTTTARLAAFARKNIGFLCLFDLGVLDTGHAAGTPGLNVGGLTPEQP